MIPFGEFRPDLSDTATKIVAEAANVIPRADGYGPFPSLEAVSEALGSRCRGYFSADLDGEAFFFAATETDLFLLDNTTLIFSNVSQSGGPYAGLDTKSQWQFVQFNNLVLATHRNVVLQRFDLASDTEFEDNPDNPPQAGAIGVVGRFVMLADLLDDPQRVAWCGLNDTENWTFGTGSSDFQDLPDGGRALRIAGGEFGFILQALAVRTIVYQPGSDVIFAIKRVGENKGILAQYSLISTGGRHFFLATSGFVELNFDGSLTPIGAEAVDRTFFAAAALDFPQFILGGADPKRDLVFWSYKSASSPDDLFDKVLPYNTLLKRWGAPLSITGEFFASASRPGLTLEALDAIAPGALEITDAVDNGSGLIRLEVGDTSSLTTGEFKTISGVGGVTNANGNFEIDVIDGTHVDLIGSTFAGSYTSGGVIAGSIDLLSFSLDDVSTATLPNLACFNSDHQLGFFSGPVLEAVIEGPEQRIDGWRMTTDGFFPLTDAEECFGSVTKRDTLHGDYVASSESAMDSDGFCCVLEDARSMRPRVRIPAGVAWTYAKGVDTTDYSFIRGSRL
jgi:hypothetical protein